MCKWIRLALLAALSAINPLHAAIVTWNLNGVTLDDGSTANGFFTVNTDDHSQNPVLLPAFDLTFTAGGQSSAYEYKAGTGVLNITDSVATGSVVGGGGLTNGVPNSRSLQLAFPSVNLRNATDGTFSIAPLCTAPGGCSDEGGGPGLRFITAGTITASVPEPSQLSLIAIGVVLFGSLRIVQRYFLVSKADLEIPNPAKRTA